MLYEYLYLFLLKVHFLKMIFSTITMVELTGKKKCQVSENYSSNKRKMNVREKQIGIALSNARNEKKWELQFNKVKFEQMRTSVHLMSHSSATPLRIQ